MNTSISAVSPGVGGGGGGGQSGGRLPANRTAPQASPSLSTSPISRDRRASLASRCDSFTAILTDRRLPERWLIRSCHREADDKMGQNCRSVPERPAELDSGFVPCH